MIYHVSSSIELGISFDGTNNEMHNELICIDGMGDCYYATHVLNIMIIFEYMYKSQYGLLVSIWR